MMLLFEKDIAETNLDIDRVIEFFLNLNIIFYFIGWDRWNLGEALFLLFELVPK